MRRREVCHLVALGVVSSTLTACSPFMQTPRLHHPGPAGYQRANGTLYEPYPQPEVGPEIVGGRPPDYATPPNEVERANQAVKVGAPVSTYGPAPVFAPAPAYAAPAPVYTPPTPIYTPPTAVNGSPRPPLY